VGEIYCLYANENGIPRYVGMTEGDAEKRWKKHITSALDKVSGELYDWIRDVTRRGGYIDFHVLQSGIIPAELKFYEDYWITQFPDLFNVRANATPPVTPSPTGSQVILTIKAKLVIQDESTAS
jgi:hypothetical protein